MRWNAVSKQATCGSSGARFSSSRIGARLCGWCSGASGTNFCSRSTMRRVQAHRRGELGAAMHDAVSDRGQPLAAGLCGLQPVEDVRQRAVVAESPVCHRFSPSVLAGGVTGDEARRGVEAFDLAAGHER